MSNLVSRLRALADLHYPAKLTVVLREAADALECDYQLEQLYKLEAERDALKAKLAEAERSLTAWGTSSLADVEYSLAQAETRAEKAEAEYAVLREANDRRQVLQAEAEAEVMRLKGVVESLTSAFAANGVQGLGLQGCLASLLERAKRLEAVAEAADVFTNNPQCLGLKDVMPLVEALAALEKKP